MMTSKKRNEQKAFVLACRFISDNLDCPASYSNIDFPGCNHALGKCGDTSRRWECWQRYFREKVKDKQVCRVCGCTEDNACPGGCWWVEDDLCSACAEKMLGGKADGKIRYV